MWVRLSIEGNLLDNLVKDAECNRRSKQQQILYYLENIYKGNIIIPQGNKSVDNYSLSVQNNFPSVDNYSPSVQQSDTKIDKIPLESDSEVLPDGVSYYYPKEVGEISSSILDF